MPALTPADAVVSYLETVRAMAQAEFRRLRREPSVIFARVAQPLLWLLVFGSALSRVRGLGVGGVPYRAYLVPGVLAQSVLFVAVFSGLAIIWERDLGITQRLMVAPVFRSAMVLGKAVSAAVRAVIMVSVVLVVVAVVRIPIQWSPLRLAGALLAVAVGATLLSAFSMVIASVVRTREQFMGIGQLVTLPLLFASNALYSISIMPTWLRAVSRANPLTYQVEILRRMLVGVGPNRLVLDGAVLVLSTIAMVAIASKTFPRRVM